LVTPDVLSLFLIFCLRGLREFPLLRN